jgi:hypothetical protein
VITMGDSSRRRYALVDQRYQGVGYGYRCLPDQTLRVVGGAHAGDLFGTPGSNERKITRNLKRRYDEMHNVEKPVEELTPIDQTLEKEHEERTKLKNIQARGSGWRPVKVWLRQIVKVWLRPNRPIRNIITVGRGEDPWSRQRCSLSARRVGSERRRW